MISIVADENIACLDDYFGKHNNIKLIKAQGRKLVSIAHQIQPNALLVRSVSQIDHTIPHSVQFVGTATLGLDHVDVDWLAQHNIGFASSQASSRHSVAQYVITALYATNPAALSPTKTLGIIGLGHIGSTLANYAQDLGLTLLGYDPFLPSSTLNNSSLSHLLAHSDIVSIHTPLTYHHIYPTYNMANQGFFESLNPKAILVNAARGEIINEQALLDDIYHTKRQVILDVFPQEPTISKHLLDNLSLATPHIAGYTLDAKLHGIDMIYHAFCRYFELPILSYANQLLPPNAFDWQTAKQIIQHNKSLRHFYDIKSDDARLRQACNNTHVLPQLFDQLRKDYPLKREWQYD